MKNAIIAALAALLLLNWYCSQQKKKDLQADLDILRGKYELKDSAFIAQAQQAKRWKTSDSLNILRVNTLSVSKIALEAYNADLRSQLKKAKIKPSAIDRQTDVATTAAGSVTPKTDTIYYARQDTTMPRRDSVVKFAYSDKWISLYGQTRPALEINYQVKDSIRLVWHYTRDGFLKPKKLRLTAYSLNPNVTITGVRDFEVKTREKRFFIGIGGSYGYNGGKFVPTLGIIGGFKILRL